MGGADSILSMSTAHHPRPATAEALRAFRDFSDLSDEAGSELPERAVILRVDAEQVLATQGSPCEYFPLVLSGRARIFTMDEDGREVTLYRLDPGDGCVLAAMCALSDAPLPGSVVVEAAGEGMLIPARILRGWVERHTFWRQYVFSLVARQLGQVLAITNELAFRRLDTRIAAHLLRSSEPDGTEVRATHQAIALEVGTRREVVSRILKEFEQAGVVSLGRGVVRLIDRPALRRQANPEPPLLAPLGEGRLVL